MAVLAADIQIPHKGNPTKLSAPCAGADAFYKGALLFAVATTGKATVAPGAAARFLGIVAKGVTTTAADQQVEYFADGFHLLPFVGAAVADMGREIYMDASAGYTDNPADLVSNADTAEATNDMRVGVCHVIEGTAGWVNLHEADSFHA